jgi:hypothetical protein
MYAYLFLAPLVLRRTIMLRLFSSSGLIETCVAR